jgi:hypothetical protein
MQKNNMQAINKFPECILISKIMSPPNKIIFPEDARSQINAKIIIVKKKQDVKMSAEICPENQGAEVSVPTKQSHNKDTFIDECGSKTLANFSSKKITRTD